MGLWQNLVTGYDENRERLSAMFPLSATTISNNGKDGDIVVVVLDDKGVFKGCYIIPKYNENRDEKPEEFVIPVSEKSLGRCGNIAPHPIFDQFKYLCGNFGEFGDEDRESLKLLNERLERLKSLNNKKGLNKDDKEAIKAINEEIKLLEYREKFSDESFCSNRKAYLNELRSFAESEFTKENKAVMAVYNYMKKGVLGKDLQEKEIYPKENNYIFFEVECDGKSCSKLWEDSKIFDAWHSFYVSKREGNKKIDFINGDLALDSDAHPKKIMPAAGNAKLISSNDTSNFTFRGLFSTSEQAVTIGYESSQKAHQFLRYLIALNGITCGEQVIVPFSIQSQKKVLPKPPIKDDNLDWDDEDDDETVADEKLTLKTKTGVDYAESIRNALTGYKLDNQWTAHARSAILVLESGTPGRLSITFYREFSSAEYLEKIQEWHESCKWPLWRGKGDGTVLYFGAPSIDKIIQAAFGWPKAGQGKAYNVIRKRARQELIRTILDNAPIPRDYLENAIRRVSNPLGIADANGKFDYSRFLSVLATTCAIFKHETNKESLNMSIDIKRTDRDYLYGRLLGAADMLEQYALRKKDNDRLVTAAIRHMQTFSQRPFTAWQIIHNSLLPYIQQVRGSFADREIQAIHDIFDTSAFESDLPLSGLYLVGYYHERAYIDELINAAHKKSLDNNQSKED